MPALTYRGAAAPVVLGLCCLLASACAVEAELPQRNQELSQAEEVFRMFCMRLARDAAPFDPGGNRFVPACEGRAAYEPDDSASVEEKRLAAFVARRPEAVSALMQTLGAVSSQQVAKFQENELENFLLDMLPFYEPAEDTIIPRSTRALDAVMQRLKNKGDDAAGEVRETLARIAERKGYRSPDQVLAPVQPFLSYSGIDELSQKTLKLVSKEGPAHETFMQLLEAAALELAEPKEETEGQSSLSLALELALTPDERFNEGRAPLWVLDRDDEGNARASSQASEVTPFPVAGRADSAERDEAGRALGADGKPLYQTFDVNTTMVAALMRDNIPLVRRDGQPRSTVEKLLRSLRPMLGEAKERSEKFGSASLTYEGQDVEKSALAEFAHAVVTLLKFPETRELLEAVEKLMATDETSATELIHAGLAIDAEADKDTKAKIVGIGGEGTPSEFWDDMIGLGQRIIQRDGLLLDIITSMEDPVSAAQGKLIANLMKYRDDVKLGMDLNAEVKHTWAEVVDRNKPDTAMNRSLWQRIISLIDATYAAKNCNKDGATLTVQVPIPTTFPNPLLVSGLVCPASTITTGTTWKQCEFIEQKAGAVTHMRSMLEKTEIKLKDSQVQACASAVGEDPSHAQERESGIKGFTLKPTPQAIARYIQGPRNKFLTDLFDPFPTRHGVDVNKFEPNVMFALEVRDMAAAVNGEPKSFLETSKPLLAAFDKYEEFDDNGDPTAGYLFAEFLQILHNHWPAPKAANCDPAQLEPGCSQRKTRGAFFAEQSNLVSYEPLLVYALQNQDLLGALHRGALALRKIKVGERDGVQVLARFLDRVLRPDPKLSYRDGRTFSKTNTCELVEMGGKRSCKDKERGRVIEGVAPIYLLVDGLAAIDNAWKKDEERHKLWLEARSKLVDQFLTVKKEGAKFSLSNRRGYAVTMRFLPWLRARIDEHVRANDVSQWVDGSGPRLGLVDRALGVIAHPITARAIDLYDHFWADEGAGVEVAKVTEYLLDEEKNPEAFTGALIAAADVLKLLDRDPSLTPAWRFLALGLAPNALEVSDGAAGPLDVENGPLNRLLEVTYQLAMLDEAPELSPLARLLKNLVTPMRFKKPESVSGRTPIEVLFDVVADVNRGDPTLPTTTLLDAEDNRRVFDQLSLFLSSKDRGLERLYEVIGNRKLTE